MKQRMPEMGLEHRIKELENFIESELERVKQAADDAEIKHSEWEKLNSFFYKNAMKVAADKTKKDPYEALIRKTLTLVEILS